MNLRSFLPLLCGLAVLSPSRSIAQPYRLVPDTLDLRANARLSLNFLEGTVDRHQPGLPYFTIYYGADPVALSHMVYDLDENPGRWLYAFVSTREVCGGVEGLRTEEQLKLYLYSRMDHDDGLVYLPKYSPTCNVVRGDTAWMWGNRSAFMGLFSLYMVHDTAELRQRLDAMVDAVDRLAVRTEDGMYLAADRYAPGSHADPAHPALLGENMGGWITPLAKYYAWTANKKAWALAQGFAAYIVKHHADAQRSSAASAFGVAENDLTGSPNAPKGGSYVLKISNVHGALFTIGGVLRVAELSHNAEQVAWAKDLVDYCIAHLATSFGWVPEHEDDRLLGPGKTMSSEGCAVADLVNCCIYLARNGHPEYWNYVERYVRNYLEEAQLKNTDWMPHATRRDDTIKEAYDDVASRIRGAYVGWGDPNDWVNPSARNPHAVQNCCGPHCAWVTSLVWHNIVRERDDGVYVNLMLNKRSPWCEVLSYHPYAGRVDVEMYVRATLHVLVPDWVDRTQAALRVNGHAVPLAWDGPYLVAKNLRRGDKVEVDYPLRTVTLTDTIRGKGVFHTKWKGNTVVAIDPPGKIVPLFQRELMLASSCPMKQERVLEPGARVEIPVDEIDW